MDLTFSEPELAFRDELRAWFAEHAPGPSPSATRTRHYAWRRDFQRELARRRLGGACTGRGSTAAAARR